MIKKLLFEDGCVINKCVDIILVIVFKDENGGREEDQQAYSYADQVFVNVFCLILLHVAIIKLN
jgi:hypothetical protein